MKSDSESSRLFYIHQLTWLRGIAAFFVIISHVVRATEVQYSPDDELVHFFLLSLFDLGTLGVVIFFVLSGCTLFISYTKKETSQHVRSFYIKRFFRIYPAFIVSLLIYILFTFVFSAYYGQERGHWIEGQFLSDYTFSDILAYMSLVFNITGPTGLFNNAFWSLPVEFQYYILFPLIILSLKVSGVFGPILIGLLLYMVNRNELISLANNVVFTLGFTFCGGILVGYIYQKRNISIHMAIGLLLLALNLMIAFVIMHDYIILPDVIVLSNKMNWYGFLGIISVYTILITRLHFPQPVERALGVYGAISYSTYLYHNLFVAIAVLLLINYEIHDGYIRLFFTLIFTLIMTQIASKMSYAYIEKPFIKTGSTIAAKIIKD